MSPQPSIAHYRITAKLGEGGMGEVWRATDTKLNREVAIKILPDAFANDSDRLARFQHEAQVLASLNHPNIAAIYGVEERALVMELVEGPNLSERLAKGAIPLEDALPIARQIAEALEYAHERGIVHRDLKPANIKVTSDGRVKVLDFGLAKALAGELSSGDPSTSPTVTMGETQVGAIMGTPAYMSPEQARGQNVDRRADIWAFGVVLYEMLTGRQLFGGRTTSDALAAVLKSDVDLTAIPAQVRPVLERCLRREPRERWHCMGDSGAALTNGSNSPAVTAAPVRQPKLWIAAAVAFAIAATAGWWLLWRSTRFVSRPLVRLNLDLGPDALTGFSTTVAISPDGRRLVFPVRGLDSKPQLATRLLDQSQTSLLTGTENGADPFFSPDGQSIGFFASGQLKRVSVDGSAPTILCPAAATQPRGGSWGENGAIVAALNQLSSLSRLPSSGGNPQQLGKLGAGEISHRWPQVLPGGETLLFTAPATNVGLDNPNTRIEVLSLTTGKVKVVLRGGYFGRYSPTGHLVYVHQGGLWAVKFDLHRMETSGSPVRLLDDLAANSVTGGGQFDLSTADSDHGTLVYTAGKSAAQSWIVSWLESSGKTRPLITTPGAYTNPRFSPDGRKLAFFNNGSDVYIYDLERDATTQLSFTGSARTPAWTLDGKHIVFGNNSGGSGLWWMRSNGSGEPQSLLDSTYLLVPYSFSPNGRLAYYEINPETGYDLWTVPLDLSGGDQAKVGKPELFLRTPADEGLPRFSPDGRWIAYRSNESGRNEIYVRPFPPEQGGKWPISNGGGLYAFWSRNGRELFYETEDSRIMVVEYSVDGEAFVPRRPRPWCDEQVFYPGVANLDLAPDGKRFAVLTQSEKTGESKGNVHVTMLLNFFDELKRRLP